MTNQSFTERTSHQKALGVVLLLFILSIFIRLPNINRPVSKHYEFNTAVILINIISWRQAGGGDQLGYTPVMNFQYPGDKLPPNNLFIDKNGNTVYLSFGPGWYVIPYFFYQWLHLPAVPLYLEILNLVFHLATILLFFYFLEQLIPSGKTNKYFMITAGCCFMIFSPGPLWFLGNGYVNTGVMIPFILGTLLVIVPVLRDPARITASRLLVLGLLIVTLIYIDWFIVFLCFFSSVIALFKYRQNKKYGWLTGVLLLSVISGIFLVFFQFASHMGREAVLNYWLRRSSERSMNLAGTSFIKKFFFLPVYFLTSFLPLILLLLGSFLSSWHRKKIPEWSAKEILFIRIMCVSLIFYNLLLFNWSTDHEFAVLPWCILLSFVSARFLGTFKNKKLASGLLGLFIVCAIAQYYWINRPGAVSKDGLPYNSFKKFGESLSQVPSEYTICINLEQNPMVEYYAGRNILRAPDSLSAKNALKELGIKKAVWVTQKDYQLGNIRIIQ